jgi:hypothetical protein
MLLNPTGNGMLGGFFDGRTLLGSNLGTQLPVVAVSWHFFMKVRKFAFFFAGILSLLMWLITLAQLS